VALSPPSAGPRKAVARLVPVAGRVDERRLKATVLRTRLPLAPENGSLRRAATRLGCAYR